MHTGAIGDILHVYGVWHGRGSVRNAAQGYADFPASSQRCGDPGLRPRQGVTGRTAGAPRAIVFAASGTIHLKSTLRITQGDLTVAGQTAPGEGVFLAHYALDPINSPTARRPASRRPPPAPRRRPSSCIG